MSSKGTFMDSLSSSQGPEVVSTVLDQDNIGRIRKTYQILNEIGFEVSSIFGKVTPAKGN